MADPRRLFDAKDIQAAALYVTSITGGAEDFYPLKADANGYLLINMTVGSLSLTSTETTINNSASNPANVSLTNTKVTIDNTVPVSGSVSLTNTKVTVDNTVTVTGTVSLSNTSSTINNAAANPVPVSLTTTKVTVDNTVTVTGSVSLTNTKVTIESASAIPVSLSSTKVTVDNSISLTTTQVTAALTNGARTLTCSTGSLSATQGTITFTPTNKVKVYAFSLTTTSATEVTAVFFTGTQSAGLELWRVTLMAPAGANSGANLAIPPPAFLFASRTASAVTLSLSSAVLVHYSISYFDEA